MTVGRVAVACANPSCGYAPPEHMLDVAFRLDSFRQDASCRKVEYRKRLCVACEAERSNARKRENRWLVKADSTIKSHARRLGISRSDLVERYGWDRERMARDAERAYHALCDSCEGGEFTEPISAGAHGLADVTLDILHRDREPFYVTNVRWICSTCNREKGILPAEQFERKQQFYRARRAWLRAATPFDRGALFDVPA